MKWQNYSPISSSATVTQQGDRIFSGIWIRWSTLTQSEKVVCACIVLIPLWWLWGWSYLTVVLALSILAYQVFHQGSLQLQQPSLFVIAGLAHGLYELLSLYFWEIDNGYAFSVGDIRNPISTWLGSMPVLWYIKSHKIRIRLQVVAWAFSVVVVQMLIFWLVIYFIWKQANFIPSRSLFGLLTAKGEVFVPGVGNSNYLMPYFASDSSIPGMVRYIFFFHGPESLALVVSFICLLALDIKQRVWSLLLFCGSFFLLLLSGTRSVWLYLPIVLILRWLITTGKNGKVWLVFALIALVSFVTLAIPPVNDVISKSTHDTAESTGELRGDSTKVRSEIYRQTWDGFVKGSDSELIFGHVVPGETVLPGYAPAMVGSHSFLLSTLLYLKGLLGTGIFLTYWISLLGWLYGTRISRPMCSLLVYLLFSLTFSVMEFESVVMPLIFITTVLYKSTINAPNGIRYFQIFRY